ncbi:MAG: carbohydrate ABC transporter permease [Christensenellales bacterium]|jgi:ABC-type sugar transport system permease subunit
MQKPSAKDGLIRKYRLAGVLFLLPAILIYLAFTIYPFFDSLVLSFYKWNGFSARTFIGLDNYIAAFRDKTFLMAIHNSVYLGVFSSIISVAVGLLLAWLMLYVSRRVGSLFRTILFSPSMIPAIITALVFAFIFEPENGALNAFLNLIRRLFGVPEVQTAWLTNKSTALGAILFVSAWKQVGLTMVLCFAGMQGLNLSLVESARLDGANDFQVFGRIILPLIMPFVQLSAIFALMSGLKIYDTVVALTAGGPAKATIVMPLWILQNSFSFNKYGYGSAMSMIFVLIVLIGMLLVKRVVRGDSYEQ